jgi:high affinity Mn2+ porin
VRKCVSGVVVALVLTGAQQALPADVIFGTKAAPPSGSSVPDWTGWYVGAHLGDAWGASNWTASSAGAPFAAGSIGLYQPFDGFTGTGSYFGGLQIGYDYMLPNRFVIGGVADASFPAFQNFSGVSIGGTSSLASPTGEERYSETVLSFGTVRGRIGYAPGNWLFYATGGFAWTYDQSTVTNATTGTTDMPFLWRLGWVAGGGVEVPIAPHWTASFEYLFTDYGKSGVLFANAAQMFGSDFTQQELRAGLNYRFGADSSAADIFTKGPAPVDLDWFAVHGQTTFVEQYAPPFHSPYAGTNSLLPNQGRETWDATLTLGFKLWHGAELWIDPEIDQGFGLNNTLGVAGFPTGTAFKVGSSLPYERIQRYFIRQTIDLGGESQKVDADLNQFAGSQTADRVVITVGKYSVSDIFDTNKYAQNTRKDFMNWSLIDAGAFDYAADAWGYSYGAAVEWYKGDWTLRGGLFDLSVVPNSVELDPSFDEFQWIGEIERRYQLWGLDGKIAVTGFLGRGRMGSYADAIALADVTGGPADIAAVRTYQSRPGVVMNLEQSITADLGLFVRAGWADGSVEPYEYTDIDRTVAAGISLKGNKWGRPDDTFGFAGIVNEISNEHVAFLNDGGLGILVGDGILPHPGPEQIIETYYQFPIYSMMMTVDYQLIVNPAYNEDRGPVSVFGTRLHYQF